MTHFSPWAVVVSVVWLALVCAVVGASLWTGTRIASRWSRRRRPDDDRHATDQDEA